MTMATGPDVGATSTASGVVTASAVFRTVPAAELSICSPIALEGAKIGQ
jgi:hypothetical protein